MILLVHSIRDIAGVNIANCMLQQFSFVNSGAGFQENPVFKAKINSQEVVLVSLTQESVEFQSLPESFPETELAIFLSRHSSQSGTPTLTVHCPGNLGKAELGGLQQQVSVAPAKAMQTALATLYKLKIERRLNYEVSFECTHHGPSLQVPAMFVELGSSEKQWGDFAAAEVVAMAAIKSADDFSFQDKNVATCIGIGGTHYNQKFTRIALENKLVFGHMIPKYAISSLDSKMISQCIDKTLGKVESIVLDWKGIKSEDKAKLLANLKEFKIRVIRV